MYKRNLVVSENWKVKHDRQVVDADVNIHPFKVSRSHITLYSADIQWKDYSAEKSAKLLLKCQVAF